MLEKYMFVPHLVVSESNFMLAFSEGILYHCTILFVMQGGDLENWMSRGQAFIRKKHF